MLEHHGIKCTPASLFLATVSALSGQPWPLCSIWALSELDGESDEAAIQYLLGRCDKISLETCNPLEIASQLVSYHHDMFSSWKEVGRCLSNLPAAELSLREELHKLRVGDNAVWNELIDYVRSNF